jgi:3-hydroxybutyryl-CoA dehydrogenase
MGAGIAEVFARAGIQAIGFEPDAAALERGTQNLHRSTGRAVQRGKLSTAAETELLGRIRFTTELTECATADLVVEAIPEQLPLKRELFGRLDGICRPETILASNTSSLSITEIAASTGRPEKVLGMHFFNPAPVMLLVEVIRGVRTDPSTVDAVEKLAAQLGKTTVTVGDRAGFVVNALLLAYLNRAATLYGNGYASREDIDLAMKVGAGLPMGPLTLLDLIGLDTTVHVLNTMYAQSADRLHAPAPILRALVAAGFVGRKAGRGFYEYESPAANTSRTLAAVRVAAIGEAPEWLTANSGPAEADVVVGGADIDWSGQQSGILAGIGDGPVLPRALASGRPADFVGLHPVGDRLVEVVRTVRGSDHAVTLGRAACGETPTVVAPDRPGFLVDALLLPHINDAIRMCESGYASAADIDTAMRLGCGYPAGPLEIATGIGLPRVLAGIEAIYADTREPGLAPAPLLTRLIAAGKSEFG